MRSVIPVLLFALAGVLVGGGWSLQRQGASRGAIILTWVLAMLAAVGGALWLIPGKS